MKNVKRICLICFCLISGFSLLGQQQTLFSDVDLIGGFGGPYVEISQINNQVVTDVGGGGGVILNNFFLGGYGQGTDASNVTILEQQYDLEFGHGGFWFGYVIPSHKLLHVYSSVKTGWGEAALKDGDGDKISSDNVFAVSPELGIELNITKWFRAAMMGGYRFVRGIEDLPGNISNKTFASPYGSITFRFGGFGYYDNQTSKSDDFDFLNKN